MTRIFAGPAAPAGSGVVRAVIVGAGHFPHAGVATATVPRLADLTSVPASVNAVLAHLLGPWFDTLAAPLGTIDFLASDPASPAGVVWSGVAAPGTNPPGTLAPGAAVDPPTAANLQKAVDDVLQGSKPEDVFLFLCCGHGFWKAARYFVPSDFGANAGDPWADVIDLDAFRTGLRQAPPRRQWLFFDCCNDLPETALQAMGSLGKPIVRANAVLMAQANAFGALEQCGMNSSTNGQQAFGIAGKPSRFCEMLLDAINGAGATRKLKNEWWVTDTGIKDAMDTYKDRIPGLANPDFYKFARVMSSDAEDRMRLRKLPTPPECMLVSYSTPRTALKTVTVVIAPEGTPTALFTRAPPAATAKWHQPVPAFRHYDVTAAFPEAQTQLVFADLPMSVAEFEP